MIVYTELKITIIFYEYLKKKINIRNKNKYISIIKITK
jgi:hypothetical protein